MGNVGYRFLVIFFGITFTLILLVNLSLFSGVGLFGELENYENTYFGYTSMIDGISYFENMMENYSFNGFFNMDSLNKCMMGMLNTLSGGINDVIFYATNANGWSDFFNVNITIPNFPVLIEISGADAVVDLLKNVGTLVEYLIDVVISIFEGLGFIGSLLKAVATMILQPLFLTAYLLWGLGFVLYWIVLIFMWSLLLLRGYFVKPLPSTSNSSWQDIADYWNSQWSSLPNGLAISL